MEKFTVLGCGESTSQTVVELERRDVEALVRVFDAVNDTAAVDDNYSPYVFLFAGVLAPWPRDETPRPINDKHWSD
jgi:hypothetical protein